MVTDLLLSLIILFLNNNEIHYLRINDNYVLLKSKLHLHSVPSHDFYSIIDTSQGRVTRDKNCHDLFSTFLIQSKHNLCL